MKKRWIKRAVIGSILIVLITSQLGKLTYNWAKHYYYDQVKKEIKYRYLEGHDAIGAYSFKFENWGILNPSGCIRIPDKDGNSFYLLSGIDTVGFIFPRYIKDHVWTGSRDNIINLLDDSQRYRWFMLEIGKGPLKCMIVKETERGFDFIQEMILGVGFNKIPPKAILESDNKYDHNLMTSIKINDISLYTEYINYLIGNKYKKVFFREDYSSENKKYNLLSYLRTPEIPSYKGKKFYQLKPDLYYDYIGGNTLESRDWIYGKGAMQLVGTSVVHHYSIQENGTVLKDLCLKWTLIASFCLILMYVKYCVIMSKKEI